MGIYFGPCVSEGETLLDQQSLMLSKHTTVIYIYIHVYMHICIYIYIYIYKYTFTYNINVCVYLHTSVYPPDLFKASSV